MALDHIDNLDELEARLRRNLESIVADLIAVLRIDIVTFAEREVRNRFIADEAFAEDMSDENLVALKKRVNEIGDLVAVETCDKLSGDMDFWFGPDVPIGEGKTFDGHPDLLAKLQGIAKATVELLEEFGFPKEGGGYQVKYAPPAYFVDGKYAPGLAESFWKNLAQLDELRQARQTMDAGQRRASQRRRWDSIDKE